MGDEPRLVPMTITDDEARLAVQVVELQAENARLRALLSWIEGACVDELPHAEIRAAIERLSDEGGDG